MTKGSMKTFTIRPGVKINQDGNQVQYFCQICKIPNPSHFMLRHELWIKLLPKGGIICFACLEKKLKRLIAVDDLIDAPVNGALIHILKRV